MSRTTRFEATVQKAAGAGKVRGGGGEGAPPAVRTALAGLFQSAIGALAPERLVRQVLRRRGGALVVGKAGERARGVLPLAHGLVVAGAGKGAAGLAAGVEAVLGADVVDGVVIVPPGYEVRLRRVAVALGSHPVPDRRSILATHRLLALLDRHPTASVLFLLTGGASSLLVAPAPGVTLADKRRTGALLLASGAGIAEMNAVRKHLSAVKGGRLAQRLAGRRAVALVVSDVPGDELGVVGSGPTVADRTTFRDALRILARHGILKRVPARVRRHLERGGAGRVPETPKRSAELGRVPTVLLAGNATARNAVVAAARRAGFPAVHDFGELLVGPNAEAARLLAHRIARCRADAAGSFPVVLVAGGETTVALGARPGRGGRNQALALEVSKALAGRSGWALLSAGTDGIDGPTEAAGAFADGAVAARAERARLSIDRALVRHDAHPLLRALGQLYTPGPTGTNVADLVIAFVWKGGGWRLPVGVPM